MSRKKVLFCLEKKRMFETIPKMLIGMLIFAVLIFGISMVSYAVQESMNKDYNTYDVAVVHEEEEHKYIDLVIDTVQSMEGLSKKFNFIFEEKEAALKGVETGKYDVAFIVPPDFIYDLIHGNETKISIHYGGAPNTIVGYVLTELGTVLATYIEESEKSIFAIKDYMEINHISGTQKADYSLSINYITRILGRNSIYDANQLTSTDNLPLGIYYFCVGLILVFLFLGLQGAKLLSGYGKEFYKKLYLADVKSIPQIMTKYLALLLCFLILYGAIALVVLIAKPEMFLGTLCAVPVLLPICAILILVFELVENPANAILSLFLVIVVLGFVSGFFFPLSMLPETFDFVSKFTVTRAMLEYTKGCIIGKNVALYFVEMMGHGMILLAIAVRIRKYRIRK